ncbi:MAG TPA: hypothetical protein PKU77_12195 [Ferruginibacter sp.]|nr:hypothetical protein [Ferruginibacter sp.]
MQRVILLLAILMVCQIGMAQQAPIAIVSTNGTTRLASTLDEASTLAQDNDIIYLPGGMIAGMSNWFTKYVTVIGVGHNPDSTVATDATNIQGFIGFMAGGVLDGVYVLNGIYISSNVKIFRSNCDHIFPPWSNTENVLVDKCIVRSNIIGHAGYFGFNYSTIKNSIIGFDFTSANTGNTFENCIFLTEANYDASGGHMNTFKNCSFTGITNWTSGHNHFFRNCLFASSSLPPLTDPNNASNNILGQSGAATFVNAPTTSYSYSNDYIIKPSSPAINGGLGGTQIGIYGGTSPWVKGNVPPNPHIRTKNVDATTGAGGTLRVRFNVGAQ